MAFATSRGRPDLDALQAQSEADGLLSDWSDGQDHMVVAEIVKRPVAEACMIAMCLVLGMPSIEVEALFTAFQQASEKGGS